MKKPWLFLFALLCLGGLVGFTAAADKDKEEAIKQERTRYKGTWRVILLQVDGELADEKEAKKIIVVNAPDGRWTVVADGEKIGTGTSQIDPTKKPKTIDFTPTEGVEKGKVLLGIYEIKENCRKLCYAEAGKDRPTEFSSKPGSGHVLVIFQREKE